MKIGKQSMSSGSTCEQTPQTHIANHPMNVGTSSVPISRLHRIVLNYIYQLTNNYNNSHHESY